MRNRRMAPLALLLIVGLASSVAAEGATGSVDDNVKAEVTWLTYDAVENGMVLLLEQLVADDGGLPAKPEGPVLITTSPTASADWKLARAATGELNTLLHDYWELAEECRPKPEDGQIKLLAAEDGAAELAAEATKLSSLAKMTGIIQEVKTLAALFHSSFELKGQGVDLDHQALVAATFAAARRLDSNAGKEWLLLGQGERRRHEDEPSRSGKKKDTALGTALRAPSVELVSSSALLELLADLESARSCTGEGPGKRAAAVQSAVDALEAASQENAPKTPSKELEKLKALGLLDASTLTAWTKKWDELRKQPSFDPLQADLRAKSEQLKKDHEGVLKTAEALKRLNAQHDLIRSALTDPKDDPERKRLRALLLVEAEVALLLDDPSAMALRLKPVFGGGSNRVASHWLLGPRLSHSGAAVIAWFLIDHHGRVRRAGVMKPYETMRHAEFRHPRNRYAPAKDHRRRGSTPVNPLGR